jgi:SEC-C motif-containing protein
MENDLCPCGTQKPYSGCCEGVIKGLITPASAADLMRARYSAFARHEIDFILDSVSPARRKDFDRKGIEDWSRNSDWDGLEIVSTEKGGPGDATGQVEFIAKYREKGEENKHHELATFVKIEGSWYFDDGRAPPVKQVRSEGPKVGRNDPCPCGSGKKFKKCHGNPEADG